MDFIDAINAAFILQSHGPTSLYSFDEHFDRVPELTRIEPGTTQAKRAA